MKDPIGQHVERLYGKEAAPRITETLRALIRHHTPAQPAAPRGETLPLSEREALLIAYGDQLREPGEPPLRTLARFCERRLRGVVSGVHLLPFYPYTSDDGFSVTDHFRIDPELGGWADVRRLGKSFDLMFDAVFNHMSAQSEWFHRFLAGDPEFADFFVTVEGNPNLSQVVRPRALPLLTRFHGASGEKQVWTTFSADQVDLNFRNPSVLVKILEALLLYVANGAKFIRLDAIAYLWKDIGTTCIHLPETHRVIRLMRAVLDEVAPHVMLITETNVPHKDNVSYFGDGHNEAQLVYNFALPPLVLHSLLTADASKLTRWAQSLELPSRAVTFFNFLASHDGIGVNPARGILSDAEIQNLVDRTQAQGGFISHKHNPDGSKSPYELNITWFDAVSDPNAPEEDALRVQRFLVSQAIMLALAGVPGIYFHSLFGSRNDREGALASNIHRRINRQKFALAELETELDAAGSLRSLVFAGYRRLLGVRREHAAFHPAGGQRVLESSPKLFAVLRTSPDGTETILCLHHVGAEPRETVLPVADLEFHTDWIDLLTGDTFHANEALHVPLAPFAVRWLQAKPVD
ncbi:MAG: sugar phosphorylase [Verrucomicrobiota bacterium]